MKIVNSFDGKNFYPFLVLKTTAKTATVQACDSEGNPRGEPMRRRINYELSGENRPIVVLNRFHTVYLSEKF